MLVDDEKETLEVDDFGKGPHKLLNFLLSLGKYLAMSRSGRVTQSSLVFHSQRPLQVFFPLICIFLESGEAHCLRYVNSLEQVYDCIFQILCELLLILNVTVMNIV